MTSVLSSFFSRDPRAAFPYELPSEAVVRSYGDEPIQIGASRKRSDPTHSATCFWSTHPGGSTTLKQIAQKQKTLRHPNVLAFWDSLEVDVQGVPAYYLITEPCRPLELYLREVELSEAQRELLVSWGLYQIMSCLKFLHDEVRILQMNLRHAVFVTDSGDWKLFAFHKAKPIEGSSAQPDLNDLAWLLQRVFNGFSASNSSPISPKSLDGIPKRLQPLFRKLADTSRAAANHEVGALLAEARASGSGFMKNKFVDTLLFLDEFQLKDASEKHHFFTHSLRESLELFPDDLAKNKILPRLIHTYEYGDAGAHILVPMFKLGRLLAENEYQARIVPCLVKLFSSPDRQTRVKLLERIDDIATHLKSGTLNEGGIYGNLVGGFSDTNPAVRESTVKAMVPLAEKLNYNNLNQDLMKHLARLQGSDPEPGIRTNTTICLGKIGCFVDPSHRQRILISAFTRALKDPFPPARMAGVLSLSATQQYYTLAEVAQRILPALCPLAMDGEKQVRDQAFKSIKGFLEKLERVSDNPELLAEMEAQVKAGGRGSLLSGDKVPQWAGWALKALSGRFYKGATTTAAASNNASQPIPSSKGPSSPKTEREQTAKTPSMRPPTLTSQSGSDESGSRSDVDGWGDLDFGGELEQVDEKGTSHAAGGDGWGDEGDLISFRVDEPSDGKAAVKSSRPDDWTVDWDSKEAPIPAAPSKPTTRPRPTPTRDTSKAVKQGGSSSSAHSSTGIKGPLKLGAKKLGGKKAEKEKELNDLEKEMGGFTEW